MSEDKFLQKELKDLLWAIFSFLICFKIIFFCYLLYSINNNNHNSRDGSENEDSKMEFSGDDNKEKENAKDNNRRGSRYRGVSRNGNQWQVLIMVCKKKRYVGSYSNEEEAARAYDKAALQNHGAKAKTNFDYMDDELRDILSQPPILKLGPDKFAKH